MAFRDRCRHLVDAFQPVRLLKTLMVDGRTTINDTLEVVGNIIGNTGRLNSITATGTQNDLVVTNLANGINLVGISSASTLTITGIDGSGVDNGTLLLLSNQSSNLITLPYFSSGSLAANRFVNAVTGAATLLGGKTIGNVGGWALYYYAGGWIMIDHDSNWITPTFSAGDFTGSGGMTWTVEAGDRTTMRYRVRHKTITVDYDVTTTSTGGAASTQLIISSGQYGGHSFQGNHLTAGWGLDAGTPTMLLVIGVGGSITNWLPSTGNWSAAAVNNTRVSGTVTGEIG